MKSKTALEALTHHLYYKNMVKVEIVVTKKFYYDNSYLIADVKEAYVLETAGKYWVSKKITDYYVISNGLTIENDFDDAHPEILKLKEKKPNFSFKKKFINPLYTYFAKSKIRRKNAEKIIKKHQGNITVETIMQILRHHTKGENKASVSSICMHAGGIIGDHTTGSYIVEFDTFDNLYFVTASSLPCLSVFKPLLQEETNNECTNKGIKYWLERELLYRYLLSGQVDKRLI